MAQHSKGRKRKLEGRGERSQKKGGIKRGTKWPKKEWQRSCISRGRIAKILGLEFL